MTRRLPGALALGIAAALAAACAPEITDTGYVGTWTRGNERVRSTLLIDRGGADAGYRVRLELSSADGEREVRCEWDGRCVESAGGKEVARFVLRPSLDAASGRLRVEGTGEYLGELARPIQFLDEMVVKDHGRRLVSSTLVQEGREFEPNKRPRRFFEKVSDAVR
jgi:hypothetical protein